MFTSLSFAAFMGFTHSFEADHLLAVSNIVTKRDRFRLAIKDGIYWGLGHTSTIFLVGLVIVFGKMLITEETPIFSYFEALVGFMLIILGFYRIFKLYKYKEHLSQHHAHAPFHESLHDHSEKHHLAYGVGLVHGLAGSGAVILSALATMKSDVNMLLFLFIFGLGSVVGMLLASGILSLPFSKQWSSNKNFQLMLTLVSCVLCIGFGAKVIFESLLS
jgi:high-affinity nickel permease